MIRITKQTDYGIVLLTHLAANPERQYTAPELAAEARLPLPMVSKILKLLARDGLLASHRGVKGGYSLARPAEEISMAEIIAALEGPIAITECVSDEQRLLARGALPGAQQLAADQRRGARGARGDLARRDGPAQDAEAGHPRAPARFARARPPSSRKLESSGPSGTCSYREGIEETPCRLPTNTIEQFADAGVPVRLRHRRRAGDLPARA